MSNSKERIKYPRVPDTTPACDLNLEKTVLEVESRVVGDMYQAHFDGKGNLERMVVNGKVVTH